MTKDPHNPYASPQAEIAKTMPAGDPAAQLGIDAHQLTKVHAIIKDADQFWIAIALCILCSGIGSLIIGPWYLVRITQWQSVSKAHPVLLDPGFPPGSIPYKFQNAKSKLVTGLVVGIVMLLAVIALTVFNIFLASTI